MEGAGSQEVKGVVTKGGGGGGGVNAMEVDIDG